MGKKIPFVGSVFGLPSVQGIGVSMDHPLKGGKGNSHPLHHWTVWFVSHSEISQIQDFGKAEIMLSVTLKSSCPASGIFSLSVH